MIGRWLLAVWNWTMQADWRTWVAHYVLASLLAPIVGAWAVIVLYGAREVEQAWDEHVAGVVTSDVHWLDHVMDFVAAFVAVCVEIALFHWTVAR